MSSIGRRLIIGVAFACTAVMVQNGGAQDAARQQPVEIPSGATSLEGLPVVRVDSSEQSTTRRVLDADRAKTDRLTVRVVDGQFYWTTRGNRLLQVSSSGEFTYLSSAPGQYIRLTRLNDRITYVEHIEQASGSTTWFGELRIVLGK